MIGRIRRFFRDHPGLNRTKFAERADLHRNSFYNLENEDWNPRAETIDKLLVAIDSYESEEARAQRKTRPSRLAA